MADDATQLELELKEDPKMNITDNPEQPKTEPTEQSTVKEKPKMKRDSIAKAREYVLNSTSGTLADKFKVLIMRVPEGQNKDLDDRVVEFARLKYVGYDDSQKPALSRLHTFTDFMLKQYPTKGEKLNAFVDGILNTFTNAGIKFVTSSVEATGKVVGATMISAARSQVEIEKSYYTAQIIKSSDKERVQLMATAMGAKLQEAKLKAEFKKAMKLITQQQADDAIADKKE